MKSIGQALREIVPRFIPLAAVEKPLLEALGSVISDDVLAGADLPAFDNSAMDGYALRFAELMAGTSAPLQAESRAGGEPPPALAVGGVQRIFTGAALPEGADTVVIQENVTRFEDVPVRVRIDEAPARRGANVRLRGSDFARGSLAIAAGTRLTPAHIGILAALGRASVRVHRRPRVAIVVSGDELRELGTPEAPGTIVSSNSYALAAQLLELGAEPWRLPIVPDRADALAQALREASSADAVITVGGASVGDYDCLQEACALAGVEILLCNVAIKPGKPLLFGTAGRVPLLGLPGNPVSALVTFEVFARPALRRMAGHRDPYPVLVQVELGHDHRHATGRVELARAVLEPQLSGRALATLHAQQGSGSMRSIGAADALVVLPAETETFARGTTLAALPLHAARGQPDSPFA